MYKLLLVESVCSTAIQIISSDVWFHLLIIKIDEGACTKDK